MLNINIKESNLENKDGKPFLVLLVILFLFILLSIYIFLRAKEGYNEPYVFWAIWISAILIIIYISFKFEIKYYLIGMILFQLMIAIIWVFGLDSPLPTGSDAIFESQYAGTIVSTGHWDVHAGLGLSRNYYGYSPLLHMNMAFLSIVTGADIFVIGKYFPFLERILYFLVLYLVLNKLTSNKIAVVATLFIFCSPPMILIHTSRRLLAEPFLLLVLLCAFYQLTKSEYLQSRRYLILLPIFFVGVIIGHHMTFYFLIFILLVILLYMIIKKVHQKDLSLKMKSPTKVSMFIFIICSIIGILLLFNSGILDRDFGRLWEGISALFSVNVTSAESAISSVGSTYSYPQIYVIAALLFVVLFYLTLVFSFLKYIKQSENGFLFGWCLASAVLLFVPAIAILTGTRVGRLFGTVGWGVGAVGMTILVAKFLLNWWKKRQTYKRVGLVVLITLLYCGGLLIAYPIQYYCSDNSQAAIDDRIICAGDWLQSQTEESEAIGGDRVSYDVITGVYMRFVRYDTHSLFFASSVQDLQENITNYSDTYNVKFFVVNKIVTGHKAVGYDFVPAENLENFNMVYGLNKVYSNSQVSIYLYNDSQSIK